MRLGRILGLLASLSLVGTALASAHDVRVQFQFGTREHRFEGRRLETMRALAHYLDERAHHVAEQAIGPSHRSTYSERAVLTSITHFAGRAGDFHSRMDRYEEEPWEVPAEVSHLNDDARTVNARMRRARVFEHTWDDWDAVLDVLDRMNRLMTGQDVQVPRAHRPGWGDYDRDYAPWRDRHDSEEGAYRDARLTGRELEEFRRLAHQLDEQATRAHETAERGVDESPRGRAFLSDLHHFNEQTRALHERADAGDLDHREIASTVDHLLDDARQTNRSLRSARVFPDAWDTWAETIRTLERMVELVRF
jgi:hypothetical protein